MIVELEDFMAFLMGQQPWQGHSGGIRSVIHQGAQICHSYSQV